MLLAEASRLVDRRRWRQAVRVLSVAATTSADVDDRRHVLERLAVTSADGGHHGISCDAVFELQEIEPRRADTWVAFANVALARGNYEHADRAARSALADDDGNHGAWAALAASYAGLGWFDRAEACLDRLDRESLTDLERWRIGRAVNRWALTNTRWYVFGALAALVVGLLAVAVAVSVPFAARELRLRRLRADNPRRFLESLAATAWRYERRLRLSHAAAVCCSVAGFAAAHTLL